MSLMRKRIIAIIAAALALIILGTSLAIVLQYVDTVVFIDPADNETKYYAKKDNGTYKLYAKKSKTPLETTTLNNKTYYVTALGTLVSLNAETGAADEYIPVDTEGNENVGINDRVLIFPHIEKKNILSLKVNNEHGSYTFQRVNDNFEEDPAGSTFIIKGSGLTSINQELFAELYVGAGYTLTLMKIKNPIRRASTGELCPHATKDEEDNLIFPTDCSCVYSEYGLVPETRERTVTVLDELTGKPLLDEDGKEVQATEEYAYEPTSFVLTDTSGNKYKLLIGDALVTGGGYYAQYVNIDADGNETKRQAVYVIDTSSGTCFNAPIEDYVTPQLCYPLPMNRYYDVENFVIANRLTDSYKGQKLEDLYGKMVSFSYIDLEERENTMSATVPYIFNTHTEDGEDKGLTGFTPNDTAINNCLYNFYLPTLTRTVKFAPTTADLVKYEFMKEELDENGNVVKNEKGETQYVFFAKYLVAYTFEVMNDNGKITQTIDQTILISDKDYDTTGKYYVYTTETVTNVGETEGFTYSYDFITEAEGSMFEFLLWDEYDWVNPSYVDQNIAYIESITLTAKDYTAIFNVDNSATDQSGGVSSSLLKVLASQNGSESRETFNQYKITDKNGYLWLITSSGIKVYNATTGKEAEMKDGIAFYDYNVLGSQVLCRNGYIKGSDEWVQVTANYINIYEPGEGDNPGRLVKSILRYDTDLWRKFYQSLLYANLEGVYTLTEEEEQAIISSPENLLLTMEIKMKDAESAGGKEYHNVYKFYNIPGSARKAYIMISTDGGNTFNGGFYVYRNKVEKFVSDSQKFFANEIIVPDAKK